jgi:hypothetical protein
MCEVHLWKALDVSYNFPNNFNKVASKYLLAKRQYTTDNCYMYLPGVTSTG